MHKDSSAQTGGQLTYGPRTETRRNQALNKARQLFSQVIFWGIMLYSRPMRLSEKSAIVFAPHQDDETFGCGGLIALKRERGIRVRVVILTDGAAGLGRQAGDLDRERVAKMRNEEVVAAITALGLQREDVEFFSYPDGELHCLTDMEHAQAIDRITALLKEFQPGEVYVTHRRDRHLDHEAAYKMVTDAILRSRLTIDLLQYPIWLVWFSGFGRRLQWRDLAGGLVLPIHSVSERKRQAVNAFRSQLEALPSGSVERFYSDYELFFATRISASDKPSA